MPLFNKTRLILLVAILSATAGAVVFKTPAVLFLLATLLSAPPLAHAMGQWMSRGLRVSRQMPLVASVGDELRARLVVRNSGPIPALLVHAQGRGRDEAKRPAAWRARKISATANAIASENATYFEAIGEDQLFLPVLMPGASFTGEVVWKLKRRGLVDWPSARAGTLDPIALSDPLSARSAPDQLLILPRPLKLRRLQPGGGSPSARPLQRASTASNSAEVHGVRPYQAGEGGRRIHWRATARTGELHVIEWEEETAADLTILLDVQAALVAGAPGADSLELSIVAAASVAAFLLESGQRARIFWWADDPAQPGAARLMRVESRHQAGLTPVLTALAKIAPCRSETATLLALSARVARESGDEGALLIATDAAQWNQALIPWQSSRGPARAQGLAFDVASFEDAPDAAFTLRAGAAMTATMQRVDASKPRQKPNLPASVRRVKRDDSLVEMLESHF